MNQYEPWIELGMTELEYWKHRYIEAQKELESIKSVIKNRNHMIKTRDEQIKALKYIYRRAKKFIQSDGENSDELYELLVKAVESVK